MQHYLIRVAFGALNMKNQLDCFAAQPHLRIHAPCVPMVSLLLTIMNHTIMETRARCSVLLDYYYANFDAESDWCTVGRRASDIESRSVRPLLHLSAQIRRYPMVSLYGASRTPLRLIDGVFPNSA
jgi:hypothetical protein